MKKIHVALFSLICLISVALLSACSESKKTPYVYKPLSATVRFLTNTDGETITLSSGREVISENTVFLWQEVNTGDILTEPEEHPTRLGYDFLGWAVDKVGTAYDFSQPVTGSLNLYASWKRSEGVSEDSLDYTEPHITFAEMEKIDDAAPFVLTGVCNQPIQDGNVNLTTIGIKRLAYKSADVKELLNYTRATSTEIKSATYSASDSKVSVTYTSDSIDTTIEITVSDITSSLAIKDDTTTPVDKEDESVYERKAVNKYESEIVDDSTYFEAYNVVLAGSSSMENWSNSKEYMDPVTTKNVAIGGTTAYYWLSYLADRLIIPYNPRTVVFYVGINDIINHGRSGKKTGENLIKLFEYVHERLPEAHVLFILINHVPGYYKLHKKSIDTANKAVIDYAATHDYVKTIDAGTVLEKKSGDYSEAYFLNDKLHMSQAGYVLWGAEVKKAVIADDKERYDND